MSTRRVEARIVGRRTEFEYSEQWFGYALLGLRLVMGRMPFYGGITKVLDPGWSAGGYLGAIPETNPVAGLRAVVAAGWLWLVDALLERTDVVESNPWLRALLG